MHGAAAAEKQVKMKKADSSLPNLLSSAVSQVRRGSTGAVWSLAAPDKQAGSSVTDALLLLLPETLRQRSKSYSLADSGVTAAERMKKANIETGDAAPSARGEDVADGRGPLFDLARTKSDSEHLRNKVESTMLRIRQEQSANEENVTWYLRQSSDVESPAVSSRAKAAFEKNNQRSAATITHLQKKLESYRGRLRDLEQRAATAPLPGAVVPSSSSHAKPTTKGLLRDVSHGLREFGENIKDGVLGSLATKPIDIRRKKKMFGSADNLLEDDSAPGRDNRTHSVTGGSIGGGSSTTLPSNLKMPFSAAGKPAVSNSDKASTARTASHESLLGADEESGDLLSSSAGASLMRAQQPRSENGGEEDEAAAVKVASRQLDRVTGDLAQLKVQLEELHDEVAPLRQSLQEDRYRCERLEEHLHDMADLYQAELSNLKQELANAQEKLEYELDERSRDMQEAIESCNTKISKMELQGIRQQQVVSMEGVQNATARVLLTKLVNVALALIVVVFLSVSTVSNIVRALVNSRWKATTLLVVVTAVMVSSYWECIVYYLGYPAEAATNTATS